MKKEVETNYETHPEVTVMSVEENTQYDAEVKELVEEHPKLDAACKNLIALLSAKSAQTQDIIHPLELLQCARVLLKALNAHQLVDVVEWGSSHPQSQEQGALDRIQQLTQYKVVRALRIKANDMGGKVTKLFGKSFILWSGCWKQVRQAAMLDAPTTVADASFDLFLDTFEVSLDLSTEEQSGLVDKGRDDEPVVVDEHDENDKKHAVKTTSAASTSDFGETVDSVLHRMTTSTATATATGNSNNASLTCPLGASKRLIASTLSADKDLIWAPDFAAALSKRREIRQYKIESTKQAEWQDVTAANAANTGAASGSDSANASVNSPEKGRPN